MNVHTSTVVRHPATLLAAGLALVALAVAPTCGVAGAVAAPATTTPDEFVVWGEVDGLYPGGITTFDAHVFNPWDAGIEVTSIVVDVSDATPECPGSMLVFAPITRSVTVAPRSPAVVPIEVRMDAAAGDACRGATWSLEFTASAVGPDGETHEATGPISPADPSDPNHPPDSNGASDADSPRVFAYTGAEIAMVVALGIALILLGLFLTRAWRHRAARDGT